MDAVQCRGVQVVYSPAGMRSVSRPILRGIDLVARQGEVTTILGHNGAGKTTLLRVLLSLLPDFNGEAYLFGVTVRSAEARRNVGFLPEQPNIIPYLTTRKYLELFGHLADLSGSVLAERIEMLAARHGLAPHLDKPLTACSKGTLQRINLTRALLKKPDLLILDEPIIGLDPLGQRLVRDVVLELRREGKSVLISTHATSFAAAVSDRVIFLMGGRVIEERVAPFTPDLLEERFVALTQGLTLEEVTQ